MARPAARPAALPTRQRLESASSPRRLGWAALACTLALSSAAPRGRTLPSDAFVWQLAWRSAVARAVSQNAALFATWHVLVAEFPPDGPPALPRPDWPTLLEGGHPAVAVVRIEGRLTRDRALRLVPPLRTLIAGLPPGLRALEIDHDAATSGLAGYAAALRVFRSVLAPETKLWVTALPAWIVSPGFSTLAAAADRLVLQVHAIDDPRLGLFSARRALGWITALAARTRTPFQVALPAYGARVSEGSAGLSVSAETSSTDGTAGQEIAADPAEVAHLVAGLRQDPPDMLTGLAWFRLPVVGDARAWGMPTLRRVARGEALDGSAEILVRAGHVPGARDIVVRNAGEDDVILPRHIVLPPGCLAADGLGQYVLEQDVLEQGRLSLRGAGLLSGRASVLAGWMRCAGEVHADK